MHAKEHPQKGKKFRVRLEHGDDLQAGFDLLLHGGEFVLLDWADRMTENKVQKDEQAIALDYLAHRFIHFGTANKISDVALKDFVYGVLKVAAEPYHREWLVLVLESELVEYDAY